jgi:hypothetical protein
MIPFIQSSKKSKLSCCNKKTWLVEWALGLQGHKQTVWVPCFDYHGDLTGMCICQTHYTLNGCRRLYVGYTLMEKWILPLYICKYIENALDGHCV